MPRRKKVVEFDDDELFESDYDWLIDEEEEDDDWDDCDVYDYMSGLCWDDDEPDVECSINDYLFGICWKDDDDDP